MIAKTIYLSNTPLLGESAASSDVVAICSLVVASLALGFSITFAEVQRRHNIRIAKPHMDIDLGTSTYLLRITNHGPGVARLVSFTGTAEGRNFDFLVRKELADFIEWVSDDFEFPANIVRNAPTTGSYLAPHSSLDILSNLSAIHVKDQAKIGAKLTLIKFTISVSSIYDKIYSDVHEPLRAKDETL